MWKFTTVGLIVIWLILMTGDLAWSENSSIGQDEGKRVLFSDKNREDSHSTDPSQLFSPIKPSGDDNFLILNPDGNTASDYQKFLTPSDQMDKKPDR